LPIASILLLALAVAGPDRDAPLFSGTTARSLDSFAACFTRIQEEAGHPWAFVPNNGGGAFSNTGASRAAAPYLLHIARAGAQQRLQLFADARAASEILVQAVERCK
jgi:hypothetical protein